MSLVGAQLLGPEFQVNSFTTDSQWGSAVAASGAGGFVVVWTSYWQDGSYSGVFGQRFNAASVPVGPEFPVNTTTLWPQISPAVAVEANGGFVVVWESWDGAVTYDTDIRGQRFGGDGMPLGGEFLVNTYTTQLQRYPAVAASPAGGFIVVWDSWPQGGSGGGVFAQRFDASGAPEGDEFQVNAYYPTGSDFRPAVAADAAGNFLVAWEKFSSRYGNEIYARRFDAAGVPGGPEFRVNSVTTYSHHYPAVAADGAGNFVVAWGCIVQDGGFLDVCAQRFDASGAPLGSELRVNTYTTGAQRLPAVAANDTGDFVVVWQHLHQNDYSYEVMGRRFAASGSAAGGEFRINSHSSDMQHLPAVAVDGAGSFVVTWTSEGQDGSYQGVVGRRGELALFFDGFEMGNACAWSASVGGGCS